MNITFRSFSESDIKDETAIMKLAFDEDSMMHNGTNGGPPGYDDGSFLRKYAMHPASDAYVILGDGKMIGTAIVWTKKESHENFLGCLYTSPELHGKGVGTEIWNKIMQMYPKTRIWRTETPLFSKRNLNFYINKCGFMAYEIQNPKDISEAQVQLIFFTDKYKV